MRAKLEFYKTDLEVTLTKKDGEEIKIQKSGLVVIFGKKFVYTHDNKSENIDDFVELDLSVETINRNPHIYKVVTQFN